MQYALYKPLAFTEIGRKSNNEDRIFPDVSDLTSAQRCFVLCDGMGGHENGEVAAEIVATTLQPTLLASKTEPDIITPERFNKALASTYDALNKMSCSPGKTPGTTMTCLYFAANGVLVAHIGDSRVYQIRPGEGVVFMTSDHSLVNELVKAGQLTEEEAKTFPRRNVITRAMQPEQEDPCRADISILTDVRPGDYFFMCTDGILENIDNEILVSILNKEGSNKSKLAAIYDKCFGQTRDNFTCILVQVENVEGLPLPTPAPKVDDSATLAMGASAFGLQPGMPELPEQTRSLQPEDTQPIQSEDTQPFNQDVDLEKTEVEGEYTHKNMFAPSDNSAYNAESYDDSEFEYEKPRKHLRGWIEFGIAVGITAIIISLMFIFFKAPSDEELNANKNKDDQQKTPLSEKTIEPAKEDINQGLSATGDLEEAEDTGDQDDQNDQSQNPKDKNEKDTAESTNQNNNDNPDGIQDQENKDAKLDVLKEEDKTNQQNDQNQNNDQQQNTDPNNPLGNVSVDNP